MCTPLIIAGIALSGASMVANSVAQNQVDTARNEVLATEARRQGGYNQEIQSFNDTARDEYVGFEDRRAQREGGLADMFASSVDDPNAASVLPMSSSSIVNNETERKKAEAQNFVDQQSGALAEMRSFGDLLGDTSLVQGRNAAKAGQIGRFKAGSQGIVPLELDDANSAGDNARLFADLLRLGGTVTTGAGIGGGGIPGMYGAQGAWGL